MVVERLTILGRGFLGSVYVNGLSFGTKYSRVDQVKYVKYSL